ncbi:MAG: cytochrome b/b6 domain-containing protein [Kangiellaceae bacterium]|nr:cytochrome b/b6 domain-containing protein [Kangiellaceae bacterium]
MFSTLLLNKKQNMASNKKLVWDLPLRLFHWLFAVSILASWYTAEQEGELIELHMQLGYFILGLVIFRLVWGVVGTKHSRFEHFFPKPSTIYIYLKTLRHTEESKHAGHNPLGSLMVILMITLILLQAVSGLFVNDDIFSSGPYYGVVSKGVEQAMMFIHHNAFDLMIAAIGLHISTIFYYRFHRKVDLITPMINGKKPAIEISKDDEISHSKIIAAIIVTIAVTAFIYWLVVLNIPMEEEYFY